MPFLFILLIAAIVTLLFGLLQVAVCLFAFTVFIAAVIHSAGGFQHCPKCGSRLTVQIHDETPDFSYGPSRMHPYVVQKCWHPRCLKTTVLEGLVVTSSDEPITGGS